MTVSLVGTVLRALSDEAVADGGEPPLFFLSGWRSEHGGRKIKSMEAGKSEKFRALLQQLRSELEVGVQVTAQEAAPVQVDSSIGRVSRIDAIQNQQIALALKQRQQQQLLRVERALKAIDAGTYGRCGKCGGAISEERLEAQPDAVCCVQCAGKK